MRAPPVISRRPLPYLWLLLLILPVVALGAVILFRFNPTQYSFYPRCALYAATGIYCPGCGSLRALHQLTHGQFAAALQSNLLLILGVPLLALDFVQFYYRRSINAGLARLWVTRPFVLISALVIVILFTVLRNIHASPFTWLAPS